MSPAIVFVGDPMCSWCYGFSHELLAVQRELPDLPIDIRMAGLWAGGRDVLDDTGKRFRLQHWGRVEALTGLPFNRSALLARDGFVYDTEPISRAFVAARHVAPRAAPLPLFHALQRAFYADGLDTTDASVLAVVAAGALAGQGFSVGSGELAVAMRSPTVADRTRADFAAVRAWGLKSFPQLLAIDGGRPRVLVDGFAKAADIRGRIERHRAAA